MGLDPFEKTELWINNITLEKANLTDIACAISGVLGLSQEEVFVVDVRPSHITLDILSKDIPIVNITGKEKILLETLGAIPGVHLRDDTYIHSNGIFGLLCLEEVDSAVLQSKVDSMTQDMRRRITKRAIIFPTGFEVGEGLIEDTNTPFLKSLLEEAGFQVETGPVIQDELWDVEAKLQDAVSRGFGLIITTGGVGAEDKDKTVEGVLRLDPKAETPYIMKFKQGTGRHIKDGVRIALGQSGFSWIVALPGPNDEVRVGGRVLFDCYMMGMNKEVAASKLAQALVSRIQEKQRTWHHH
jgi:molybdenum cofactor synthesis domain-containing protein